jgi:hypothetical protein
MKQGLALLCIGTLTLALIELFALFVFRSQLQTIFPYYARSVLDLGRAYPQGHFKEDSLLGFDLAPLSSGITFSKPYERGEYQVWVNSFGCFDEEWDIHRLNEGIYLAGDSFTWGYAPFEESFGGRLSSKVSAPVYSCGVTHTGQRHQLKKFLRLFKNGLRPDVVIVNIYANDLDNDFFSPILRLSMAICLRM